MSAASKQSSTPSKERALPTHDSPLASVDIERGVHFLQHSNLLEAKRHFERAALANPQNAIAVNCLGIIARMERRIGDAIQCFQKALDLRPNFAEAYNNLGNALRDDGQLDQARDCYRRAITLRPVFADAYNNLGVIHLSQQAITEAIRCFETAIEQQPSYAEAHNNLANAFRERGELIDAVASFTTALQLKPGAPEIHNNLGNVLRDLGQLADAKRHYELAVQLRPDFAEALGNVANVLIDLEQGDAAIDAYRRAFALQPSTRALVSLGNAYKQVGRVGEARDAFVRAASMEPADIVHSLRVSALCPVVFASTQESRELQARALREWTRLATAVRDSRRTILDRDCTEPSFHWQFLDGNVRPLKEAYARVFSHAMPERAMAKKSGRPRIGIVVARGHEGLFVRSMRGILERLDDRDFDLVIVCPTASETILRKGIQRSLQWLTFPDAPVPAARAIRDAQLDVLYHWEIGTDATSYFLPFFRTAPIQCTSWGIQVTSGIAAVDFYLSNRLVEPPDAQEHYTEQLLLAPTFLTYQNFPPQRDAHRSRESFGFGVNERLYVCAQQPGKFHPDFDPLLAGILERDPNAVIIGGGDRYGHATRQLLQRFERTIPDAARRIRFAPRLEYLDYLDLLACADVLLDPPHFGGVNSTYDAVAVGKPVVTCPSDFHRGRYTAACFRKMGIDECIVGSATDYIERAVRIANEPDYQMELSRQIRAAREILFHDAQAVVAQQELFEQLIEVSRSPTHD